MQGCQSADSRLKVYWQARLTWATKMCTQLVLKHDVARFTIHESNLADKNSTFARKVVAESRTNNCSQPATTRFVARQV